METFEHSLHPLLSVYLTQHKSYYDLDICCRAQFTGPAEMMMVSYNVQPWLQL